MLALCNLHIHFYPFSQCWVAQAHQGAPVTPTYECPALPSLCWSISGSLPCPLHQNLWQLVWQVPPPLSAGEADRQHYLYRLEGKLCVSFQLLYIELSIYRIISYFWLLPKKTSTADLYQHRKKCTLKPKQMCSLSCD